MAKERIFRMKRFNVRHQLSANKVGVDGVIVGAWCGESIPADSEIKILDAGCGCGLIAMMLYQRFPNSEILGIDIDGGALTEAQLNVNENEMSGRISIKKIDFVKMFDNDKIIGEIDDIGVVEEYGKNEIKGNISGDFSYKFDLIVSNPPFFHSGIKIEENSTSRMLARHSAGLAPETLIVAAGKLLADSGILSLIAPACDEDRLSRYAGDNSLKIIRKCHVRGNPNVAPKRILMEFRKIDQKNSEYIEDCIAEELIIEFSPGNYTPEYTALCRDFYLKF